jgi:imidazoleglycerol-phosphate dehydratase/histidinol-phosphatase
MKKRILFIDRDGTLIHEPEDWQIDSFEKLRFLPECIYFLKKIVQENNFELVLVTNQDGLGTPSFPEDTFWPVQNFILQLLADEGIHFQAVHIDKSFAHEKLPTRKPGIAMLEEYFFEDYDLENSYVIGDRYTDIQLAKNLNAKGILIGRSTDTADDNQLDVSGLSDTIALQAKHWREIYSFFAQPHRTAKVHRKTSETDILVELDLDGTGKYNIHTGLGFFDHMLTQLARHGDIDINLQVNGDLHIDEHHTIEDTALALGEAMALALGNKIGIERYGFVLPMDDILAQVAIDFGGRPWIVWKAQFNREYIGDMPTEMFFHFFKSFSDASKCNLNIKAEGDNEHHKIEGIFKALAKAIKYAKIRSSDRIPSTKGTL